MTEAMISQITKGVANERHEFLPNKMKYALQQPNIREIVKIDGTVRGTQYTFKKAADYRLNKNMVEWIGSGERPDDFSSYFVNYVIDAPHEISDVNPGSVVRTLIESIALELDLLYAQMDQVYRLAYIDTASGKSLDMVVSILGISRKPAGLASGEVTFGRETEPAEIEVQREAHRFSRRTGYPLRQPVVKKIRKIEGTKGGTPAVFIPGTDFRLLERSVEWLESERNPDPDSLFYVDYTATEAIVIPAGTNVSNYSRDPGRLKVFRTTRDGILTKNPEGKWETDIPIVAVAQGRSQNVFAGTITVMPKPPLGIEYVINRRDILNGTDTESDEDLRVRAKRALEMAGKATLTSIRSAIEGLEGVTGQVKVVDQPDGIPGIVQVIVSGGDEEEIRKVIEETRAAGIRLEFKRPVVVPIDIEITVKVKEGADTEQIQEAVDRSLRDYFGSLQIDEDVILNRIVQATLQLPGVQDVEALSLNGTRGNVTVGSDQKAEMRMLEVFMED
jgi:uncharacterized phage protein gp47/JayE